MDSKARATKAILSLTRRLILSLLFATGLFAADAQYDGSRVHYESYGKGKEAAVFITAGLAT